MYMKVILSLLVSLLLAAPAHAQRLPSPSPELVASESATASESAVATPSGIVEKKVEEKTDLTQPTVEVKNKLERVLEENQPGPLSWHNFLKHAILRSVKNGVPVNTLVLILLFPLIVAIVAAARHLIGVRGVGILTPALLSVAFLATGIWAGIILFLTILALAMIFRLVLRRLKLQYLPRMALLLWVVSAGVLGTLLLASIFNVSSLVTIGIFPILILMLLAETFIDIQVGRSSSEAKDIILQTFILSTLSSLLMAWDAVQRMVLLFPEAIFLGVAVFDVFVGRYTGLRLTEYLMFRKVAGDEEEE